MYGMRIFDATLLLPVKIGLLRESFRQLSLQSLQLGHCSGYVPQNSVVVVIVSPLYHLVCSAALAPSQAALSVFT